MRIHDAAQARKGYVYYPERNPNLQDMPAELPVDRETCAALWDKEDLRNGALEKEYYTALEAYVEDLNTAPPAASAGKRKYMCSHCGVPKKGHVCPKATPKKRKASSAREAVKRMRK